MVTKLPALGRERHPLERLSAIARAIVPPRRRQPYGNIVGEAWDQIDGDDRAFALWMIGWTKTIESVSACGAALYVFGGIGTPREGNKAPFRPFYRYVVDVEHETGYRLSTHVT